MTLLGSVGEITPCKEVFNEPLMLSCGASLPSWELTYETYGTLASDKKNAVLVCHALSGNHHAAGVGPTGEIGWWDNMIGPGKPIDTNRFYVVSPNNIGGCHGSTGPSSLCQETGMPYGSKFPMVTVEDWVRSQQLLADRLGISRFIAVVGGSLGGMQALQWAISAPDRISHAIVVAAAAKLDAQNIAFNDIARQAILQDPAFNGGDYYDQEHPRRGLKLARMLGHVTYLSDRALAERFGRERREESGPTFSYGVEFQVESYLRHQGQKFSGHFDANTYLLMTRALDYFDPAQKHQGDLAAALAPTKANVFVVSFNSDWRFPKERSREMIKAFLANGVRVSYAEIPSKQGHDSFLLYDDLYHNLIRSYFCRIALGEKNS